MLKVTQDTKIIGYILVQGQKVAIVDYHYGDYAQDSYIKYISVDRIRKAKIDDTNAVINGNLCSMSSFVSL